jgi:hypothetical protein
MKVFARTRTALLRPDLRLAATAPPGLATQVDIRGQPGGAIDRRRFTGV